MRFALLAMCFSIGSAAFAQDSAAVLAQILADKGTISASELARVNAASPASRLTVLTAVLQEKGLLTSADMARLNPEPPKALAEAPAKPSPGPSVSAPPVTAQSKFPLTLYGTILLNGFSNDALTNLQDIPLFASKQGSDALGNDKNFGMTARQTRFGLRYQGGEIAGARFSGQLEFDLLGGKAAFGNGIDMDLIRLRLAFGRLDWDHVSFEAGQDWAVFSPLNPTSLAEYAIPSMSASGNPWIRLPQIRTEFKNKFGSGATFLAQFAALDPDMGDYNTTTFSSGRVPGIGERGRAPAVETRLALTGHHDDRDFTVGLSGHYAHGKNSGMFGTATLQLPMDSWGVNLDYSLPFSKFFNVSGEAYTGRALGIFSVTSGEAILPVGGLGDKGVRSSGGWAQAQLNLNPKWQVNVVYGIDDPNVRDLPVGNRTRNQTYMGNLMYKVSPHMTVAWEYRRLLTDFRNQPLSNERGDVANLAIGYFF